MTRAGSRLKVGVMSRAHVHADGYIGLLAAVPEVEVFVADPDGAASDPGRRDGGLPSGVTYVPDYRALLGRGLDGVIITSETAHHAALVDLAAEAGTAILCEKPLATSAAEARSIESAIRRTGSPFMIAYPVRFMAGCRELSASVRAGQLGRLVSIRGTNNGRLPVHRPWFVDPALSGGGALFDHVVHVADLIEALQPARPRSVTAVTNQILYRDTNPSSVETGGLVTISYDSGLVAAIDCSWSLPATAPTWGGLTVHVTGTLGDSGVDPFRPRLRGIEAALGRAIELPYGDSGDPPLIADFLRMARTRESVQPDLGVALRTLGIVLAAVESDRTGRTVDVPDLG